MSKSFRSATRFRCANGTGCKAGQAGPGSKWGDPTTGDLTTKMKHAGNLLMLCPFLPQFFTSLVTRS